MIDQGDHEGREFRYSRLGESMFVEFRRLNRTGISADELFIALARFVVDQWEHRPQDSGEPVA
jgi:hypothetical protein